MKIIMRMLFTFFFIIIAVHTSSVFTQQFNPYFSSNLIDLFDDYNQNPNNISGSNISNVDLAKLYLPPSYFTLVILEILPNRSIEAFMKDVKCLDYYLGSIKTNPGRIQDLVKYSAKNFPDYGDEEGCLSKNKSFILFALQYNLEKHNYAGKFSLLPFISSGYSFYGLCIENITTCTEDLRNFIVERINYLSSKKEKLNGIDNYNIKAFIHYNETNSKIQNFDRTSFFIIYTIVAIYIIVRCLLWFIGSRFFKEEEGISNKKHDDDSSSEEEEEEEDESDMKDKDKGKPDEKNDLMKKEEKKLDNKELYPKFYFIYQICSITNGIKIVFQKKGNLYYNESDIQFILFFRFLAIIFKTFNKNYDFILHNPSKEITNANLYDPTLLSVLRFSSFVDIILIITEGIIFSYKLMSFLRKNTKKREQPSFSLFLNFFFRIIPSLAITLFIFIGFYVCSNSLIALLNIDNEHKLFMTKLQHVNHNLLNCSCTNNWKTLIPFYMQYSNYEEQDGIKENCFNFITVMINLFYCYLIFIILTFVSFKLRKKLFDIIISIIFLINFCIPNSVSCTSYLEKHNYFNIKMLLGEKCSTTYTHLFISYYFFGFLIGIALFYNKDITNDNSLQNSGIYNPFSYLQDFTRILFRCSTIIHVLIIIITVAVPIFLFNTFHFYLKNYQSFYRLKELNGFDKFAYLNEKKVFAIFFGFLLLHLNIYINGSTLKKFGDNIIIISFNRFCFEFYAFIEITIAMMYSIFGLNFQITPYNIFYSSFGISFFVYLVSLLDSVIVHLPIKMLTKKLLTKDSQV